MGLAACPAGTGRKMGKAESQLEKTNPKDLKVAVKSAKKTKGLSRKGGNSSLTELSGTREDLEGENC